VNRAGRTKAAENNPLVYVPTNLDVAQTACSVIRGRGGHPSCQPLRAVSLQVVRGRQGTPLLGALWVRGPPFASASLSRRFMFISSAFVRAFSFATARSHRRVRDRAQPPCKPACASVQGIRGVARLRHSQIRSLPSTPASSALSSRRF